MSKLTQFLRGAQRSELIRAVQNSWPRRYAKFELMKTARSRLSTKAVSIAPDQILPSGAKVFAMGSCFAREIRDALRSAGCDVYPKYKEILFDKTTQQPSRLPNRDEINHYDTFGIRQEIERATNRTHWNDDSLWKLVTRPSIVKLYGTELFQDPLRRNFYATSFEAIRELRHKTDLCIDEGLALADVVIITLGLTECWRDKKTSLYVCQGPWSKDSESFSYVTFHPSTYEENRANLREIIKLIRNAYPRKTIVLTVSPVRLSRTWTNEDVVVANTMSKSTLRAVTGEICREDHTITYWPSFELSTLSDIYETDNVHVRRNVIRHITRSFVDASLGRQPLNYSRTKL